MKASVWLWALMASCHMWCSGFLSSPLSIFILTLLVFFRMIWILSLWPLLIWLSLLIVLWITKYLLINILHFKHLFDFQHLHTAHTWKFESRSYSILGSIWKWSQWHCEKFQEVLGTIFQLLNSLDSSNGSIRAANSMDFLQKVMNELIGSIFLYVKIFIFIKKKLRRHTWDTISPVMLSFSMTRELASSPSCCEYQSFKRTNP